MSLRRAILILASLVMFAIPTQTFAFGLDPGIIELNGKPGDVLHGLVNITNTETDKKDCFLDIQSFEPSGVSGQQSFHAAKSENDLPNWIFVQSPRIRIEGKTTNKVEFEIRIPKQAEPGGHYAVIFFSNVPPSISADVSITGSRIGALIFLTVDGSVVRSFQVNEASAVKDVVRGTMPVELQYSVENTGNTHIIPQGSVSISNIFGSTVANISFNTKRGRVLPASSRLFNVLWQPSNFSFGPYRASANLSPVDNESKFAQPLVAAITFYVWPRTSVIVLLSALTALVIALLLWQMLVTRAKSRNRD